jgi:hypothetical protein
VEKILAQSLFERLTMILLQPEHVCASSYASIIIAARSALRRE